MASFELETKLSPEDVLAVYEQLALSRSEGSITNPIYLEREGELKPLFVDETQARAFMAQFNARQATCVLKFYAPHLPSLENLRTKFFNDPIARSFLNRFISGDHYLSFTLTNEDTSALEMICQTLVHLHQKSPMAQEDLDPLIAALVHAKRLGILPRMGEALHRMVNKRAKHPETKTISDVSSIYFSDPSQQNHSGIRTRYYNASDLAAQVYGLVLVAHFESRQKYGPYQLLRDTGLVDDITQIKRSLETGWLALIVQDDIVPNIAGAFYDVTWNRIVCPKTIIDGDFFDFNPKNGFSPAQVIHHELGHALSDAKQKQNSLRIEEAGRYFNEVLYVVANVGIKEAWSLCDRQDLSFFSQVNASKLSNDVHRLTGLKLDQLVPASSYAVRTVALSQIQRALTMAGGRTKMEAPATYLEPIAEAYTTARALGDFLLRFSEESLTSMESLANAVSSTSVKVPCLERSGNRFDLTQETFDIRQFQGRKQFRAAIYSTLSHLAELYKLATSTQDEASRFDFMNQYFKFHKIVDTTLIFYLIAAHQMNRATDKMLVDRPGLTESMVADNRLEPNPEIFFKKYIMPNLKIYFDFNTWSRPNLGIRSD